MLLKKIFAPESSENERLADFSEKKKIAEHFKNETSVRDVYVKVVQVLMYSTPELRAMLRRDGDPEIFLELLTEFDTDLDDMLTMADLHPADDASKFDSIISLRPFLFNIQHFLMHNVANCLDKLILHYDPSNVKPLRYEEKTECFKIVGDQNASNKDSSQETLTTAQTIKKRFLGH